MKQQRGAALLTAMMIVVLVATLASGMVWQQWRAVQVEAAERARTQSAWILSGALDWARLILREDAKTSASKGLGTRLGEPWSFPLAEARLSSFLAVDKEATSDDGPPAFLSGSIADAQARYNLRNLVEGDTVLAGELAVLQRLFDSIGVSPDLALRIATGLHNASPPSGALAKGIGNLANQAAPAASAITLDRPPNPPLLPQRLAQLAWFGIDAASIERMAPFVTLLPASRTTVNLNTAPREVLAAVIDGLDLAGAERLRLRAPFNSVADAQAVLGPRFLTGADVARLGVLSNYFEVRGRLRLEDRVLDESSLVLRNGIEVVVLQRERVASREAGP